MNILATASMPDELGLSSERLARIPKHFSRYVQSGRLKGYSTFVSRFGEPVLFHCEGLADAENERPVAPDTIFRIYSMTKPICSLALMLLYEEARFELNHAVSRYLPAFKDLRVWDGGSAEDFRTVPCEREMTILDLLTHTSGLTYGFMQSHPVDALYRRAGINGGFTDKVSLAETCERLAEIPLLFSPGKYWSYSIATDVVGRLVEVMSGQSLDAFLQERIFMPLGMIDTGFDVPADKLSRFAANYERNPTSKELRLIDRPDTTSIYANPRSYLSGGGGLVSTVADYFRFCQMCLNGGELDGVRIASRKTLELMTLNHLPGGKTMKEMDNSAFSETGMDGMGFGLGFSVLVDQALAMSTTSVGSFSWGGAASTYFWIDPEEEIVGIFMTQLMPSRAYPLRPQFQQLVYGALDD